MSELLPHPITGGLFPSPVIPGTGWPGDPATESTPVARSAAGVARLARSIDDVGELCAAISVCRACKGLVRWREDVASVKRASFAAEPYWGRPIPGWGDESPGVLIIGLAPAANGGNRTGRIFTGDRSGDWLFASLHRVGLAVQGRSAHAGDGQRLVAARMMAAVRCAPPQNKPTVEERDVCAPWLERELSLVLGSVRAVVCLGSFGWDATLRTFRSIGYDVPRPKPRFGHGAEAVVRRPVDPRPTRRRNGAESDGSAIVVLGSYHPSQQNTFTGRLTAPMLDAVLGRAAALARAGDRTGGPRGGTHGGTHGGRMGPVTLQAITVIGQDRPGIIAETTGVLADLGLNLEDSTMTLLRGHFAMTLICAGRAESAEIEQALAGLTAGGSLTVSVREVPEEPSHEVAGSSYVLTVHGGDRPGIVSSVVAEVARVGGNITDLTTRLAGELYLLVAEVDLPSGVDVDALGNALEAVGADLGVGVGLRVAESDDL